jgi:hypothetical protein
MLVSMLVWLYRSYHVPAGKYAGTVLVDSNRIGAIMMASPSIHCLSMRKLAVSVGQLKKRGRMTEQPFRCAS